MENKQRDQADARPWTPGQTAVRSPTRFSVHGDAAYNGIHHLGLRFFAGVAHTDDAAQAATYRDLGFKVTDHGKKKTGGPASPSRGSAA